LKWKKRSPPKGIVELSGKMRAKKLEDVEIGGSYRGGSFGNRLLIRGKRRIRKTAGVGSFRVRKKWGKLFVHKKAALSEWSSNWHAKEAGFGGTPPPS